MNFDNITTYTLYSRPYLDTLERCYKNIVTISSFPKGPLSSYVTKIKFNKLSPFKQPGPCSNVQNCGLVLTSLKNVCYNNCSNLMVVDEVPNLFSLLLSNGYKIDTSITKMLNNSDLAFNTENENKIICLITYIGN
jgi:hypothetical protein